jgi:hypothetical protein
MFAVFGSCKAHADARARKTVKDFRMEGGEVVYLGVDEWERQVKEKAAEIFSKAKPKKISIIYAAKREALQFRDLAVSGGEAARCYIACRTANGFTKKGKPKFKWMQC